VSGVYRNRGLDRSGRTSTGGIAGLVVSRLHGKNNKKAIFAYRPKIA
jgi:hypothetical protein